MIKVQVGKEELDITDAVALDKFITDSVTQYKNFVEDTYGRIVYPAEVSFWRKKLFTLATAVTKYVQHVNELLNSDELRKIPLNDRLKFESELGYMEFLDQYLSDKHDNIIT